MAKNKESIGAKDVGDISEVLGDTAKSEPETQLHGSTVQEPEVKPVEAPTSDIPNQQGPAPEAPVEIPPEPPTLPEPQAAAPVPAEAPRNGCPICGSKNVGVAGGIRFCHQCKASFT